MKKRVLASFIFLSCFSVLAAACGGNTKSQTTTHNTTTSQKAPEKAKTPTQAVAPKVVAPVQPKPALPKPAQTKQVKKVVHITVKPSDKDHQNVVNLIVK